MPLYSVLKLFTGFANAAFTAWKLIVNNAIPNATTPASTNTHHSILILYTKSCNHVLAAYHASGLATTIAIIISSRKSLDNNEIMLGIFAPNIFLIPISFVRCTTANAVNPNNPKQASKIASVENVLKMPAIRC